MKKHLPLLTFLLFSVILKVSSLDIYPTQLSPSGNIISGMVNYYARVTDICNNTITVSNTSQYSPGDTVMIIQMKGAVFTTSNSVTFGNVTDYRSAGLYEINVIEEINSNELRLRKTILNTYNLEDGKVQILNIPYLADAILLNLTCQPWNGTTGGILALSGNNLTMMSDINVSGRGFRGGFVQDLPNDANNKTTLNNSYFYGAAQVYVDSAGRKGEGITVTLADFTRGKGHITTGGGGGNNHNCGGGGGSNITAGGRGGAWTGRDGIHVNGKGLGGQPFTDTSNSRRIFLGGGGGAGHSNNGDGTSGGNGGGIVFLKAQSINAGFHKIIANGLSVISDDDLKDGAGGGGAGGSVILDLPPIASNFIRIEAKGGNGGQVRSNHGQGGGGSGGVLLSRNPLCSFCVNLSGGASGPNDIGSDPDFHARNGAPGAIDLDYQIPFNSETFPVLSIDTIVLTEECNNTTTLFVEAAGLNLSYSLDGQGPVNSPDYSGLEAGQHTITIADGCEERSQTFVVTNYPSPIGVIKDLENIYCDSLGKFRIEATPGKPPLRYSLTGQDSTQTNGFFDQLEEGFYTVRVEDVRGCFYEEDLMIEDRTYTIEIQLPVDTIAQEFGEVKLVPLLQPFTPPHQYEWYTNETIDCTDCPSPIIRPSFNTTAELFVKDFYGCTGEFLTNIRIVDTRVYQPTAFSPNNDGINDQFRVYFQDNIDVQVAQLSIFNRWGTMVYERFNFSPYENNWGWDGYFNGTLLPAETYTYVFILIFDDNENNPIILKGTVNLMR